MYYTHGYVFHTSRRYRKFEPFYLGSQAKQVTFIPYPRVKTNGISWSAVIKVVPRGLIVGKDEVPMQHDVIGGIIIPTNLSTEDVFLVDPENQIAEDIEDDKEYVGGDANDEFDENSEIKSYDSENNE
ncbi:unnamed protein product [Cochlearia groenlandica]